MSTDTPDDAPYVMGPGPDYTPPPTADLVDPEVREQTHTTGRDLVLAVLDERGIRKTENGWKTDDMTTERNDR